MHQVHGSGVVAIDRAQSSLDDADALVTSSSETPLCVLGADCALVGLASERTVAAAHAGWRGLVAGVIDATVQTMRERGAEEIDAVVSACVHAECYPFSSEDLDRVAAVFGDAVVAHTPGGGAALDLPAALRVALQRARVDVVIDVDSCTACGEGWFSHRARRDRARQALVIWRASGRG